MIAFLRFLVLVLALNAIRHVAGSLIEGPFILPPLLGVVKENASYSHTEFERIDSVTSYAYSFAMWFAATWIHHLCRPILSGHEIVRGLKALGLTLLFFASVSFVYVNHNSHRKASCFLNVVDALAAFKLVGLANGLLNPLFMPVDDRPGSDGERQ